jgi:hypothetical protein
MAEAKKMMESKEFKKQMKQLEKDPSFKKAMKDTAAAFEDPRTAGMMTAKAEQMMREGGASLDKMQDGELKISKRLDLVPTTNHKLTSTTSAPRHGSRYGPNATGPPGYERNARLDERPSRSSANVSRS